MTTESKVNFTLFALGLLGIIAMVFSPIPIELPEEILQRHSKITLSLLMMLQPIILLVVAVFIGKKLTSKVGLSAPSIEGILNGNFNQQLFKSQFLSGSTIGFIAGITIAIIANACIPLLPKEMVEAGASSEASPIVRFLYGGITEEILVRWGFMTLFVWVNWKIFNKNLSKPSKGMYWMGIFLAAFIFGVGHLPIVYKLVENVTPFLIGYIIILNMIFGIIAGWLFWKKGIEAAIIAHIFAHIGMIVIENFI